MVVTALGGLAVLVATAIYGETMGMVRLQVQAGVVTRMEDAQADQRPRGVIGGTKLHVKKPQPFHQLFARLEGIRGEVGHDVKFGLGGVEEEDASDGDELVAKGGLESLPDGLSEIKWPCA